MKKKILTTILAVALLIAIVPLDVRADDDVRMWVDGKYIESDADPYIEVDRTLVPIRFIAESLGYDVDWENATRTVIIDDGKNEITMQIGNKISKLNGKTIELDTEPTIKNDRTYVPVRYVAESLGKYVDWDNDNYTVVIGKGYQGPTQGIKGPITADEAREIALNFAGSGARITEFESDDDEYEIDVVRGDYKYEFEISKRDGAIVEIEVEYKYGDDIRANGREAIGREKAIEIAQAIAPGRVVDFEFDDGKYEIEIKGYGYEYDIEINAYDGSLLEYEREIDDDDRYDDDNDDRLSKRKIISADEAKKIALDMVNGRIVEFELDYDDDDDDDAEYEIKIVANGKEYEFEIDAYTGEILEFEIDD